MSKQPFVLLAAPHPSRQECLRAIQEAPDGSSVVIDTEATRTAEQNAIQWPILRDISKRFTWVVNGDRRKMTEDEWKDVLTAGFRKEQPKIAAGWDGGMVMLGQRTREFKKSGEWSDWVEFLNSAREQLAIMQPQTEAA